MREVFGPLFRWLLRPGSVGALYLTCLVLFAGFGVEADADLGSDAESIATFVQQKFGLEVARVGLALVAASLAVGAGLGVLAGALLRVRDRIARAPRRSAARRAFGVLGLVGVLHGWLFLRAMATSPQLYADAWYAKGGLRRTVQVLATDTLGPWGILLFGMLLLLAYLAGPPSSWRGWPGRLRRLVSPRKYVPARRGSRWPARITAVLALALLVLPWLTPRVRAAAPSQLSRKPNVLVLAADSLRADRLNPNVMPHLSALASRGARFDRAYVSLPRTFPSWTTLLTGRHPHHHGIRSMFPRWEERAASFDALPSRLAKAGYRTEVVSDYAGDIFRRIDLGFSRVRTPTFDFRELVRQRAIERQTPLFPFLHTRLGRAAFPVMREMSAAAEPSLLADDAVRAILGARDSDSPYFLTVFFSTAHFPYAAPAPYYRKFTRTSYRGRFKYKKPVGLGAEAPPDDEDIEQIRGLYDGAVASIDAACERILEAAERSGPTIVVVLSDHGETLYEGGHGQGHGDHLFGDEGTHIPFVIVDPEHKVPVRNGSIVRDVDLAPTLYELTGVAPPPQLDGVSLVPALEGKELTSQVAFAETGLWFTEDIAGVPASLRLPYPAITKLTEVDAEHHDEVVLQKSAFDLTVVAKHRMARDERFKLVYAPTRKGAKYMLFDTASDPAEMRDVAADNPAEVARLKSELFGWMARDPKMHLSGELLLTRDAAEPSRAARSGAR